MAGLITKLLVCVLVVNTIRFALSAESCYEPCFRNIVGTTDYAYRDVYDRILEIGQDINQIRNTNNVGKVGFLIDSSLSDRHRAPNDPNQETLRNGTDIFALQVLIARALAFIINGRTNFITQYDERAAWSCADQNCIQSCTGTQFYLSRLTVPEMRSSSYCPGNLEAGCRMLSMMMNEIDCKVTNQIDMAVAIVNGDFFVNDPFRKRSSPRRIPRGCPRYGFDPDSDEEPNFFSNCQGYFNFRYLVAVHEPKVSLPGSFPSDRNHYRYFHDSQFALNGMQKLVSCMTTSCNCAQSTTFNISNCFTTNGPMGELTVPYPGYPNLQILTG